MLKLQLALSTNRIHRLRLPDPVPGVGIVVVWQGHSGGPVPPECLREDVEVVRCDIPGLSNSRNVAISACTAPVVMLADDDLLYTTAQLQAVIEAFDSRPEIDMALFKVAFPRPKGYPEKECTLGIPLPKGYNVTSMEIAFRNPLPPGLKFDPRLGLGSKEMAPGQSLECGEEELFLHRCLLSGLECRFIPIEVCTHPQLTTGQRPPTPGVLRGMGAVVKLMWPRSWFPRLVVKAWRTEGSPSGFASCLRHLLHGAQLSRKLDVPEIRTPR